MLERIIELAAAEKSTLMCVNLLDPIHLWATAQEAHKACADIHKRMVQIIPAAKELVQMCLAEFHEHDKHRADFRIQQRASSLYL